MIGQTVRTYLMFAVCITAVSVSAQPFSNYVVKSGVYDGECTVIINPANTQNIIAAENADFVFRSFDGGVTWQDTNMSSFSSQSLLGDVALAANSNGQLYFQAISGINSGFRQFRSTDGGINWNSETFISDPGYTQDKNWLLVDRVAGSPYEGRVYTSWTRRSNTQPGDYGYLFLRYSADSAASWSPHKTINTETGQQVPPIGSGMACGPGGEVYVSWGGGSPNCIRFSRSADGGDNWLPSPVIIDNSVQPVANYFSPVNSALNTCAQFTSLACDAGGSIYNGNLYCTWSDVRNGADNADVFMARSTDNGQTWTTQRINDDLTTRNQLIPSVAVDQSTGWVYIAYMDARENKSGTDDSLHYYLAFSADGGQTFTNVQVSNQLSTVANIHSDYMGIDAINGHIGCLWVGGLQSTGAKMWYAPIQQSQLVGIAEEESDKTPPLLLYPATPNPAIDFTAFDFQLAENDNVTLTITDINGRAITTLLNKSAYTSGRHQVRMDHGEYRLAAGMYVATITTGKHTASRKFTVYK